ncbi:MAG: hypothetical protein IAE77_05795 [Prosthecobacter sp.]|jgi:hypothetical protein|uniref:hypothetical protein n=1 Tax=Prosthecobacter sp. TaxID=1965333 RepID=UPI0019E31B70|nr:hypothetical protein [Prosthecobacter sp.]MBE2282956.1 hypothetical protein [Prosthecobacter sp.]
MILSEELIAVTTALEAAHIEYAVCGGFAVGLHGYPRMTFDLDLLIMEADVPRFERTVFPLGFDVVAGTFAFKRGTPQETRFWRVSKFDGPDHLVLDALLVMPVFESVWASRQRMRFDSHELWVVSREGLATMKQLSGRAKDLADLQNLGILPADEAEPEPV